MTKYNKPLTDKINKLVLDAVIARFTGEETIEYVKAKCGVTLNLVKIAKHKQLIITEGKELIDHLRKDSYAYKLVFLDRIRDTEKLLQIEWKFLYESLNDGDHEHREQCIKTITNLEVVLANFYQYLPAIDTVGIISNTESGISVEQSQTEQTQSTIQRRF